MYDFPVRLSFPEVAKEPEPHFRVIVFGAFFSQWNPALIDTAVWRAVPGVTDVVRVTDAAQITEMFSTRGDTVIIPLGEDHIRQCPGGYRSLIPDPEALEILSDKARFALFMEEAGLSALCPRRYLTRTEVAFPCVLKRVDQNGGYGIEVVNSAVELEALLKSGVFRGQEYLLQAFVPGDTEYTFHCVCKDGKILWSFAVSGATNPGSQTGIDWDKTKPITPSLCIESQIATVLELLRYSGPCCVNYKILPNGDIAMFEINPRLGGSLVSAANRQALAQAFSCIIANAR